MYKLLDNISSPSDLKSLSISELRELCSEVRDYMIKCCAQNPGHLGASLGAVEIIAALHYVYDTPKDKLVFDVGHQAYAHKILTGRKEAFKTNRTKDGISGFPKIDESPYDAFGAGHSSTSISAALGLAESARILGKDEKVVAVIGDGAMTGGLAFEGMNNAGSSKANLLIILNDNDQSIDKPTGAIHNYLLKITTSGKYNRLKKSVWDHLGEGWLRNRFQKWTIDAKSNLVRKSGGALFEALGFRYFGPIDGNDLQALTNTLSRLKNLHGPRILHVHTKKGKGYAPAEASPAVWHAPGRFNPETGERILSKYDVPRWQDVFGDVLTELARRDPRVVGVTPAMASGCGMSALEASLPERFYDVGIEEEHAVTFSAGLAAGGLRPFCNIYSSFSQRAYDQIIHDVALQRLPVVLCFDRGGVVGEDGPTHQGVFDMAAYRSIPGAIICSPRNELELKNLMFSGLCSKSGPYIIRYPRGCAEGVPYKEAPFAEITPGTGTVLKKGGRIAILALGNCVCRAMEAAAEAEEKLGLAPTVIDLRFLKPLDEPMVLEAARTHEAVLTVEDGCIKGGLYGAVAELLEREQIKTALYGLGVPDEFIAQDTQKAQRAGCGIDKQGILQKIERIFFKKVLENKE
ncbi:MAG: 1-deoxy-D-xylulose-5-phosphate synthase [Bacteroidales bacterium]|nr:1-deoxy-D-xylulose-5-phosphate synthase [Bacteroidales bacterium]